MLSEDYSFTNKKLQAPVLLWIVYLLVVTSPSPMKAMMEASVRSIKKSNVKCALFSMLVITYPPIRDEYCGR